GKLALAYSSAYSSSKFALTAIAHALYQELYGSGVSVTNIAPGWVESEIHQIDNLGEPLKKKIEFNHFGLMWPAKKAAKVMVRALYERKREEVITGHGKLGAFLGSHFAPLTYWGLAKVSANTPLSRIKVLDKR
ncbi:MAG TPA: SDR family NAD(P)-dependent oxidoreductase, partial [Myxococcota bacterium]|nr:SDR family NAD(P)-dependent oxidoreductase [Myxococcota bacterium]